MAIALSQSEDERHSALWRPDDKEYTVWSQGTPLKLYWSEMTRAQKLLQIEAEERAVYVVEFGIYQ